MRSNVSYVHPRDLWQCDRSEFFSEFVCLILFVGASVLAWYPLSSGAIERAPWLAIPFVRCVFWILAVVSLVVFFLASMVLNGWLNLHAHFFPLEVEGQRRP